MKKHLLANLKTSGGTKERIRYFQLLSYVSLIGNLAFILTILKLLRN